ncbi:MAG: DUF2726 domain-containing protein [Candidatus Saccharimonadales bacterium]
MESLLFIGVIILIVWLVRKSNHKNSLPISVPPATNTGLKLPDIYFYSRKRTIMTDTETNFYHRLEVIAGDKYYIFPQIHLSALLENRTRGRYWKAAFQRANRRSVDYVLCNKQTMSPVYAVELDDSTHDTYNRHIRDAMVEKMLSDVGLPLVRFRNIRNISNEQIVLKFQEASRQFTS